MLFNHEKADWESYFLNMLDPDLRSGCTIDKTIAFHEEKAMLRDEEMYEGIKLETATAWRQEARDRWSEDLVASSERKVKAMGKDGLAKVKREGEEIARAFLGAMPSGHESVKTQELCKRQWDWIRNFYEPSAELFAGLGAMYRDDPRFAAQYEALDPGLPAFMASAMAEFAGRMGEKNK